MAGDNKQKQKQKNNEGSFIGIVKGVWRNLNQGNDLKKKLEQAKITGKSEHHADNYAHILTDAKIAQKGVKHAVVAFGIGVAKEVYDFATKVVNGQNIRETYKDCKKDMKNNLTGLKWGLSHPNEDAEKWLASLDLDTNTFKKGYDNGIAQKRRELEAKKNLKASLKQENRMARKTLTTREASNRVPGKVLGKKQPENKVPASIKRPEETHKVLPIPVWQRNRPNSR